MRYFDLWEFLEQAFCAKSCPTQLFLLPQVPEDCLFGHMSPASASFMIQALLSSLLAAPLSRVFVGAVGHVITWYLELCSVQGLAVRHLPSR